MVFTSGKSEQNDEKIAQLNEFYLCLNDVRSKLLNISTDTAPFELISSIEAEMGFTFDEIHNGLVCAQFAIKKIGYQILVENSKKIGTVYLIGSEKAKILKIGYTKSLEQRLKQLQANSSYQLRVIKEKPGTVEAEKIELTKAKEFRIQGEWFTWNDSIIENF